MGSRGRRLDSDQIIVEERISDSVQRLIGPDSQRCGGRLLFFSRLSDHSRGTMTKKRKEKEKGNGRSGLVSPIGAGAGTQTRTGTRAPYVHPGSTSIQISPWLEESCPCFDITTLHIAFCMFQCSKVSSAYDIRIHLSHFRELDDLGSEDPESPSFEVKVQLGRQSSTISGSQRPNYTGEC
jgi:hypothetical protein